MEDEAKLDQLEGLFKDATRFLEDYAEVNQDEADEIDDLVLEMKCFLRSLRK